MLRSKCSIRFFRLQSLTIIRGSITIASNLPQLFTLIGPCSGANLFLCICRGEFFTQGVIVSENQKSVEDRCNILCVEPLLAPFQRPQLLLPLFIYTSIENWLCDNPENDWWLFTQATFPSVPMWSVIKRDQQLQKPLMREWIYQCCLNTHTHSTTYTRISFLLGKKINKSSFRLKFYYKIQI